MSENPILALFDIDGTLLRSGEGARKSLSQAIEEVAGAKFKIEPEFCAGKTDPLIISRFLEQSGCLLSELQGLMIQIKKRYLELLTVNYNSKNDATLYPGIPELLEKISEHTNVHLALLTGNYEQGARIKLDPFQLNPIFPIGGFGDDGFLRTDLSHIALARSQDYYKIVYRPENIVVIGDTADDVRCGKVLFARTIVTLRRKSVLEDLKEVEPDHVFDGTEDVEGMLNAVLGT